MEAFLFIFRVYLCSTHRKSKTYINIGCFHVEHIILPIIPISLKILIEITFCILYQPKERLLN